MKSQKAKGPVQRGEKTRQEILKTSVDLASAEGLEGLTIGRLAKELKMSKSGLFAHFGSKEDLQLAALEAASLTFVKEIVEPTADIEPGLKRLVAMLDAWIESVEKSSYRGGCFFFAVSAEMDDRPGKVRAYVAELTGAWVEALEKEIKLAVRLRELRDDCDVALLAFQIHGYVQEANWFRRLHHDNQAFEKARRCVRLAMEINTTDTGKIVLSEPGKRQI